MNRGVISVGDLAVAFRRLAPGDDATRQAIAALLDLDWQAETADRSAPPPPVEPPPRRPELDRPSEALPDRSEPTPRPPVPLAARLLMADLPSRLTQTRSMPRRSPPWLDRVDPLELPNIRSVPEPELPPLFEERYTRSILSIALASERPTGDLDLDVVLDTISRGRPLDSIPRRLRRSLGRGTQLLLDRSEGMLPYLRDLPQIEAWIHRVAGTDGLQVLRFAGCPTRGAGPGSVRTRRDYWTHHMPPRGARVLCVTDLGAGRPLRGEPPASPDEWLAFAGRLGRAGCPLLVLTPYGPERLPPELTERLPVLHWSRTTRASTAARATRRGGAR